MVFARLFTDGTCNLHMTHGMIKYRGSTSGAVMTESAVAAVQTIMKLICTESSLVATFFGSFFGLAFADVTSVVGVARVRMARTAHM